MRKPSLKTIVVIIFLVIFAVEFSVIGYIALSDTNTYPPAGSSLVPASELCVSGFVVGPAEMCGE